MLKAAIPLIHVGGSSEALTFYGERLGFKVASTYRPHAEMADPAYHVVIRDAAVLHLSSFSGDGVAGGVVTILVDDIESVRDDLLRRQVDIGSGIMDQSWGNREIYVRDPWRNMVRFQSD